MTDVGTLVHSLRSTSVRKLVTALEKDGFVIERETPTGCCIYSHDDGRIVVIDYRHGSDTLTRKTFRSVLQGTRWTQNDLRHLKLIT